MKLDQPLPASPSSLAGERAPLSHGGSARRRHAGALAAALALVGAAVGWPGSTGAWAQNARLPQPRSLRSLLSRAGRERRPVVAMFSVQGCPWCAAIRLEQLNALLREEAARGVRVVEFDLADEAAFDDAGKATDEPTAAGAGSAASQGAVPGARSAQPPLGDAVSPAALARRLGVKIAPTLVFLGPEGEIAERLVGYGSPDFFSAYLDDRIETARRAIGTARRTGAG